MTTKNPKITNEHHDYTHSPCASWEYDGAQGTMRYAMGHWCFHYGSAAQWVEESGDDTPLAAVLRAIKSGEMSRLLKMVRDVTWTNGQRTDAVIDGRIIARISTDASYSQCLRVELYWNQRAGPTTRTAKDLSAAQRMVYNHAAQHGVADPYAYLAGLEDATA